MRMIKNKYKWKNLGVFAGVLLIMLSLGGCIGQTAEDAEPLEKGKLKVGMNLNIPGMCYLSEETSKPEGFEVEVAEKLADKMNLDLEIVDTSEENLLKSLDADLYDCVISGVGIGEWNDSHYAHTPAYADISSVRDKTGIQAEYTEIAVFTKKYNPMVKELERKLEMIQSDGTLKEISQKYFEKDITVKK